MDALPKRLQRWWDAVAQAASAHALDACLVLAVLDRESLGGVALKPKGETGTGDWTPRHWGRYASEADAQARYRHWRPSREEYEKLTRRKLSDEQLVPELCVPIDGMGFGRGLMQIDYSDPSNRPFLLARIEGGMPAWQSGPDNIAAGAAKLGKLLRIFDGDEHMAAAAYNAGPAAVRRALLSVTQPSTADKRRAAADSVTTGKNYASDVMGRARHFRALLGMDDSTNGDEETKA